MWINYLIKYRGDLATSCEELTHWKRPWCWEGLEAGREGDDRGWDGWMASPTRWTLVWVNSGSWWWTGRPGVLRLMGSQRVGHDWATELKWTEVLSKIERKVQRFPIHSLPLHMHSPPRYQRPPPEGYIFYIDEPPSTHHYHPKSIVHIRVHSWCRAFCRFGWKVLYVPSITVLCTVFSLTSLKFLLETVMNLQSNDRWTWSCMKTWRSYNPRYLTCMADSWCCWLGAQMRLLTGAPTGPICVWLGLLIAWWWGFLVEASQWCV